MGSACSMKISSEHLEIRSPIFGCILDNCSSSCMKKSQDEEVQTPPIIPFQGEPAKLVITPAIIDIKDVDVKVLDKQ